MPRQDRARVTLRVDGRDCGVFSKREGGGVDSEETRYRPGGGEQEVSLGGTSSRENVTLTGLQTLEKRELVRFLDGRAGKGVAEVTELPLDADDNVNGPPFVWTGTVKAVTAAETDSTSSDPAEFEVEIAAAGPLG